MAQIVAQANTCYTLRYRFSQCLSRMALTTLAALRKHRLYRLFLLFLFIQTAYFAFIVLRDDYTSWLADKLRSLRHFPCLWMQSIDFTHYHTSEQPLDVARIWNVDDEMNSVSVMAVPRLQ